MTDWMLYDYVCSLSGTEEACDVTDEREGRADQHDWPWCEHGPMLEVFRPRDTAS